MHRDLSFRLARNDTDDSRRFCELFNSLYARHVNGDYYRWQFFETPFPSQLSMAIGDDGELIGCYGIHLLESVPIRRHIAWSLDIMIAPRYQGRGIFRALVGFAVTQLLPHNPAALCVMANQRADRAHVYGLGWRRVNELTSFVCPTAMSLPTAGDLKALPFSDFEEFAGLWPSVHQNMLVSNLRSAQFLNWRFMQNPWYRYASFVAVYKGQPFGYVVLKVFRDPKTGQALGDIVDLMWRENSREALAGMLGFALDCFCRQGIAQATMWLQTNTLLDEIGRDLGFLESAQKRYFCCKILDGRYGWLEDPTRWFITMAAAEIY